MYIIDTTNGDQYHRSPIDNRMCRCNKIEEWEREGKREFMGELDDEVYYDPDAFDN